MEDRFSLLFNGFCFTGESWMIDAINQISGITAFEAPVFELVEPETADDAAVLPAMATSTGLTGASAAWELGFTGKGMTVAIIDTGIRQTHEAFSVMPAEPKMDLAYLLEVYGEYGDRIHAGSYEMLNDIYYNEKLPFNWDYFDGDADPNHTASDHGTHVAGIAAGNNGDDFRGVAPDAQIVTMQVFQDNGGASFATIILALEDCVYLGVDALNMSLGSPAGHTSYDSVMEGLEEVYEALENAGISVAVAAGNEEHAYTWTNYGDWFKSAYRWPAENPDNSVIGSPASFPGSFAVASVVNTSTENAGYVTAYGRNYYPGVGEDVPLLCSLPAGEYEAVFVGLGSMEEIEAAGGVEGKIAISERGDLTFNQKVANAQAAGAVGCIIYNNRPGAFNPAVTATLPFGSLTQDDGLILLSNFEDGVYGKITIVNDFDYGSVAMAMSSSWGSTADLKLKPEIAAPGDNITSAIGFGGDASYQTWSGTSMASPSVAGGLLLIKDRLRQDLRIEDPAELNRLAYAFMMSTAHKVQGFVRQQGAGLMDVEAALTTDAYLTVPGAERTKLELDDSDDGVFTFSIEATNIGDEDKTYTVSIQALTEAVSDYEHSGTIMADRQYALETGSHIANPETVTVKTITNTIMDVTDLCEVTGPETVTVPAGETVTIEMTIACSDELMAYFTENCPAGMFLEGYVRFEDQAEKGIDLSVPFLGYVGDWDYPAMVDDGFWWQLPYGQNNPAQMSTTQGTYIGYGTLDQGLGINFYADMDGQTYLADRHAISPNGDGLMDAVNYMEFSFLRNPRYVKLYVEDAEGNILETFLDTTYGYRKEYWNTSSQTLGYSNIIFDFTAEALEENETVYIVLESWLDHDEYDPADNKNGRIVFPVTKDLTAPTVTAVEDGVEILDANYIAYYAVYADAEAAELIQESGVFATERAKAETVATGLDTYYVAVADYARNEAFYQVSNGEVTRLDVDAFGHSDKTIVAFQQINYNECIWEFGWQSFKPHAFCDPTPVSELTYEFTEASDSSYGYDVTSTAVYYDGTLYAAAMRCLYEVDPVTYEKTALGQFWYEGQKNFDGSNTVSLRNIMAHPVTGEMYGFGRYTVPGEGSAYWFSKVDPKTREVTPLWAFSDIWCFAVDFMDADTLIMYNLGDQALVLLDANDGTELKTYYDINQKDPLRGSTQQAMSGVAADLLYDAEENCVYYCGDGSWFRHDRKGHIGTVKFDFDTEEVTLLTNGLGAGLAYFGMHFAEDVKAKDYYLVAQLIEAIGEVTLDSGDTIKAAREAYDALPESEKALVYNYENLLLAEHKYAIMVAEDASYTAALCYAMLMLEDLENWDTSDWADHQIADLAALLEQFAADLGSATTGTEIVDLMDALLEGVIAIGNSCPASTFTDVDLNAWYHEGIDFAVLNGLMNGMDADTFAPNANLTRGQLVTVLYRAAGEPDVTGMETPFTDVADGTYYTDAVVWAYNASIVNGRSATTFAPAADISRQEIATILYRYAGGSVVDTTALDTYTDAAEVSSWAAEAMAWAVENGVIAGVTKTTLVPTGNATRAQIATILMRMASTASYQN